MNEVTEWDLKEVSKETFRDFIESEDAIAQLGEPIDEDIDILVTHYYTAVGHYYLGTIRLTEDGTYYLMVDEPVEGISEDDAIKLINGE